MVAPRHPRHAPGAWTSSPRRRSEAQEFTRLLSATYDARSEEEARAANKALDEYVEREAKNHETPEEQESQTHKRSRGQSISM